MALGVTVAAQTDIGRVRRKNQDTYRVESDLRLFLVCDGMGGAAGGEVAAELAAEAFVESYRAARVIDTSHVSACTGAAEQAKDALFHAAMAANQRVRARSLEAPELQGMGTTLVAAAVGGRRLLLVNVGDSRAYLLRDGVCSQLTTDHSFLDEQVRAGVLTRAQADASQLHSVITRAIGIDDAVDADLYGVDLEDGDFALLASDGLMRHVTDEEIAALMPDCAKCETEKLQEHCDWLVNLALDRGGLDNVTCVLLQIAVQ